MSPTLRALGLSRTSVGDNGVLRFATNTIITELDIGSLDLQQTTLAALCKNTTITKLKLNAMDVGSFDAAPLAPMPALTDLACYGIEQDEDVAKIARHPSLTRLDLNWCGGNLAPLAKSSRLLTLGLGSELPMGELLRGSTTLTRLDADLEYGGRNYDHVNSSTSLAYVLDHPVERNLKAAAARRDLLVRSLLLLDCHRRRSHTQPQGPTIWQALPLDVLLAITDQLWNDPIESRVRLHRTPAAVRAVCRLVLGPRGRRCPRSAPRR